MEEVFHLGIKALVRNNNGEVLVLHANPKTNHKTTPDHWDLPGGRIQRDEDIISALRREATEEIGVEKIKVIRLFDASISKLRLKHEDYGLILFTYLCDIDNTENIQLIDNEHTEFRWVNPKEAAKLLSNKFSDECIKKISEMK